MTLSGRTTESDVGADSEQRALTTALNGYGYIWRPWFAIVRLNLNVAQIATELEQDGPGGNQRSDDRLLSGETHLNLFPSSRFPLEAFVDIFDSRIETDTVGVALEDITTQRRERVGATQRYRTVSGDSDSVVQGVRTRVTDNDGREENSDNVLAGGALRFGIQSVAYRVNRRETESDAPDILRNETADALTLRHEIRPSDAVNVETVFDAYRDEELENRLSNRESTATAQDNFVTWRPVGSRWTVRTHLGGQRRYGTVLDTDTRETSSIGSVAVGLAITRALRFSSDAGVNRTRRDDDPEVERTFENAALNYSPRAIPLAGGLHYHWGSSGTVGNTKSSNQERSVQSASVGLRHGLDWILSNDTGRTVTHSLNESGTEFRDTNEADLQTVNHQASSSVHWARRSSSSLLQLNLSDTRTTGTRAALPPVQDTAGVQPVVEEPGEDRLIDETVQTADVHTSHGLAVTRFSSLDGDLRVGTTREIDRGEEHRFTFATASAGYLYRHVFGVDQLRFRSRLEYASNWVPAAKEDEETASEERASWDNRLDYIIGLLSLSLRRTITMVEHRQTVITVLSASRQF